jgi:F-type H+-transporting ATPase subunit gamma
MPSLREIRRKLKSVKSTQQITKAMKMVAAARLRRAQVRILSARPFAQRMEGMMVDLLPHIDESATGPLFVRRQTGKRALLLITSDKGLCGAFNTNLNREALRYVRKHGAGNVRLYVAGRKGRDYFRRFGIAMAQDYSGASGAPTFAQAELIASDLINGFLVEELDGVDLLYNEFKSVILQRVILKPFLPLVPLAPVAQRKPIDFLYEPSEEALLRALIPRYLKAQVFRALLESTAAELGARMSAMDNATRNAKELIGSLTLRLNRTRQASITKEILEVVSGAEALK